MADDHAEEPRLLEALCDHVDPYDGNDPASRRAGRMDQLERAPVAWHPTSTPASLWTLSAA
jgi:hypothetical protein